MLDVGAGDHYVIDDREFALTPTPNPRDEELLDKTSEKAESFSDKKKNQEKFLEEEQNLLEVVEEDSISNLYDNTALLDQIATTKKELKE